MTEATSEGFPEVDVQLLLNSVTFWAEVAGRLSDPAAASLLYERLTPWSDRIVANPVAVYGSVAHYLGHLATVLGCYDAAEAHFIQSLATHKRLQAPFHIARTHLEWGRMLLARAQPGDDREARAHLESALGLANQYGCALVKQRAAELLNQL